MGVRKGAKDRRAVRETAPGFVRRSFAPTRAPYPRASKRLPVFMRVFAVSDARIESPNPNQLSSCARGWGPGGCEGSPHKSWCRSVGGAAILRSHPDPHPSLRMTGNFDLGGAAIVSSLRFSARVVTSLRMTGWWCLGSRRRILELCEKPHKNWEFLGSGEAGARKGTKGRGTDHGAESRSARFACCYKFGRPRSFWPRRPIINMRALVAARGSLMKEDISSRGARFLPRVTVSGGMATFGLGERYT